MVRMVDILAIMAEDRETAREHVETVRFTIRTGRGPSHGGDGTLFRPMRDEPRRLRRLRRLSR